MPDSDPHRKKTLASRLRGTVLAPDDEGFDEARSVWNARFDRSPALVARCAVPEDVAAAVRFAREEDLAISVKGGGHDYAGNTVGEGGLLVDLGPMDAVEVDRGAGRALVEGGSTWGRVDEATAAHGLATTGGTVSTVGVAGFTLGGGSGWLARRYGLAVDNLRAARVVTADGRSVRASADENPDLFWALRGGGGNFGIVTSFEFELHPVEPQVMAGQVIYPVERADELLRVYRDAFLDAPDALMCYPFFLRIPPLEVFPESLHGTLALDFVVAFFGPVDEAAAHLAVFRELGDPILDAVAPQPYPALQQAFDAGMAAGHRWYSRSHHLDVLTDEAIDRLVAGLAPFPGDFTVVYLGAHGGAVGRVAPDATAYPHRSTAHELHVFPGWTDAADDEGIEAWADGLHRAMRPHASGGVYVNLLGDGEEERIPSAYGRNYARLRELKATWDPENVFRGNHNVPPAT